MNSKLRHINGDSVMQIERVPRFRQFREARITKNNINNYDNIDSNTPEHSWLKDRRKREVLIMKVRSCDFKIKIEKNYITLHLIAAKVTVKIHERRLLSCSTSSDPENVKHIGWYRCSTDDCAHDWDKFRIAHVQNMRVTIPDNPNFEVYTNGTLVIKKVLPVDDRKMFICIAQKTLIGRERSTTILHIAKGNIYTSDNSNNTMGIHIFSRRQSTWWLLLSTVSRKKWHLECCFTGR